MACASFCVRTSCSFSRVNIQIKFPKWLYWQQQVLFGAWTIPAQVRNHFGNSMSTTFPSHTVICERVICREKGCKMKQATNKRIFLDVHNVWCTYMLTANNMKYCMMYGCKIPESQDERKSKTAEAERNACAGSSPFACEEELCLRRWLEWSILHLKFITGNRAFIFRKKHANRNDIKGETAIDHFSAFRVDQGWFVSICVHLLDLLTFPYSSCLLTLSNHFSNPFPVSPSSAPCSFCTSLSQPSLSLSLCPLLASFSIFSILSTMREESVNFRTWSQPQGFVIHKLIRKLYWKWPSNNHKKLTTI